ncbi:Mitochondrial tRNAs modification protein, partial [Dimargaris xerosporica]
RGHTLLVIVHDVNAYTQLGPTTDDSVGDAFDKVARGLRLPWKPGRGAGAAHGDPQRLPFQLTAPTTSGGVASNQCLRANLTQWMADRYQLQVLCPPPQLCTDNGVMVAWAGIERMAKGCLDGYGIGIVPRWPLEALRHWPQVPGQGGSNK